MGSGCKCSLEQMLSVQEQLKQLWSMPLHSIESIVALAFYMTNVVQSGPLNLFSVHIRSKHDSTEQIYTLR